MSADMDEDEALRIGLESWRKHAGELVDEDSWTGRCQKCGACVENCTAAKFGEGFDPREIILKVRYGLGGELLIEHSVLWQCFKCNNCYEVCPQPVKPVEVFSWLKGMLTDLVHKGHSGEAGETPADR
ncbi:MAG: 4Fe-4S dicluster domain-containing protein [Chloroflexi bacterium]|nr:4Fe-4S dicluster domain-containing protein [Chloroflexota bacterium]